MESQPAGPRILVVEDDPSLQIMMRYNLEKLGYEVETAGDGQSALDALKGARPALIVLDWMLPGNLSGLEVCRRVRGNADYAEIPIIMLTARSEEQDSIRGLEDGADDYISKPCSIATLDARIKAILRRLNQTYDTLRFQDVVLDPTKHRVERAGRVLTLGPTEYRLLEFFLRNPRRVFSREDILRSIWGENIHVELRTVDVHIRRLRKEINGPGDLDLVRTVRSAGYALDTEPS